MRPDLMVIKNLKPDDQEEFQKLRGLARKTAQSKLEVHLFEVGYASNYRLDELFEEKKEQHAALVRALTQEGWKVVYPKEHIVALGTANHVRLETKQLLQQWLPHDSHTVRGSHRDKAQQARYQKVHRPHSHKEDPGKRGQSWQHAGE